MGIPNSTTSRPTAPVGRGWVTYGAVLLTVGAVGNVLWGMAALKDADTRGETYPLIDSALVGPLEFWGWVALMWSVVLAVGAGLLFARHRSGRVVAVTVASLSGGVLAGGHARVPAVRNDRDPAGCRRDLRSARPLARGAGMTILITATRSRTRARAGLRELRPGAEATRDPE